MILAVLQEGLVKRVRFSERNCIVTWVIFFATFVGFETLPKNLKLIDKVQIRGFQTFIFLSKFRFLEPFQGIRNFENCRRRPTIPWCPTFLLITPNHHHKKACYSPVLALGVNFSVSTIGVTIVYRNTWLENTIIMFVIWQICWK